MAFYRDDPTRLLRVQWYFVPENAPQLGRLNHFYSRIYERGIDPVDPIGERYDPHPWRGGLPPRPVANGGICGSLEQWANGALTTDPIPPVYPNSVIPVCCNPPLPVWLGGVAWGGQWVPSASAGVPGCSPCPVVPTQWLVSISGFGNRDCPAFPDCRSLNTEWMLNYFSPCVWATDVPGTICGAFETALSLAYFDDQWVFQISLSDVTITIPLVSGPFQCLGQNTFSGPVDPDFLCSGPVTIMVKPA
jgi:hypothetical protein